MNRRALRRRSATKRELYIKSYQRIATTPRAAMLDIFRENADAPTLRDLCVAREMLSIRRGPARAAASRYDGSRPRRSR